MQLCDFEWIKECVFLISGSLGVAFCSPQNRKRKIENLELFNMLLSSHIAHKRNHKAIIPVVMSVKI